MAKKETKEKKTQKCSLPKDLWLYTSLALGIAFIITLVFALIPSTTTGIGLENAKTSTIDYVNKMQPGLNPSVIDAKEISNVYKLTLNVNGQQGDVFLTLDGQYFFPGGISSKDVSDLNTTPPATAEYYSLPSVEAPSLGNNPKIEVMEFSDFQCPFCGLAFGAEWAEQYATQYGPMIGSVKKMEDYARENKITFTQYPVAINTANGTSTESIDASNAALCANDQELYWEMHDVLFEANTPEEYTGKYSKENLKKLAEGIEGLNLETFNTCLDNDTYVEAVNNMTQNVGQAAYSNTGQFGTPSFYIVVDASFGKEKIEALATAQGYKVAPTQDATKYVIIADAVASKLTAIIDALQ